MIAAGDEARLNGSSMGWGEQFSWAQESSKTHLAAFADLPELLLFLRTLARSFLAIVWAC